MGKLGVRTTRIILNSVSYVLLVGWGLVAAMPLVWMVSSAFKYSREIYTWPPSIIPRQPTFDNFVAAWTKVPFDWFLINSAIVSLVEVTGVLAFGAMVAYVLAIRRVPGRSLLWVLVLAGLIIPEQVTYIPRFMIVKQLGWINTLQGVVAPYFMSSFGVFLLAQFFQTIPGELFDASRIDGLGEFGILLRIVLPLSQPALAALAIFTWLSSWNNFFWPLLVVINESKRTVPVGLASFFQEEGVANIGHVMAGNTIAILAPLAVFILFQRHFVQGIGVTGLKEVF
ncbi:MAG: carbohydrate ABC transporter permease [Armatimonadetes bacterium]|nr:carbohydrate ABC transporter permease [Armatimonadota bacterium]